MNVWRLIAHLEDPDAAIRWIRKEDRIALGWGMTGDLRTYHSPEEITQAILRGWPESHNAGAGGRELWDFVHTVKKDDLIIVSSGKRRELVAQILGDYEFADVENVPAHKYYVHQRRVNILTYKADSVWKLAGGVVSGHSPYEAFIPCKKAVTNADLRLMF